MESQGDRIRLLRKTLGLTQADFAERIGVKGGAVSAWEKGTAPLPYGRLLIICDAYNANERWIVKGEGDMFASPASRSRNVLNDFDENSLMAFVDRLPLELRQNVVELCRAVLRRYEPDYQERPARAPASFAASGEKRLRAAEEDFMY